jgi:hypothetical protein
MAKARSGRNRNLRVVAFVLGTDADTRPGTADLAPQTGDLPEWVGRGVLTAPWAAS